MHQMLQLATFVECLCVCDCDGISQSKFYCLKKVIVRHLSSGCCVTSQSHCPHTLNTSCLCFFFSHDDPTGNRTHDSQIESLLS